MSDRGTKKHFEKVWKGGTLDGWLESGRSVPLSTWEEAKEAADAMNKWVISSEDEYPGAVMKRLRERREQEETFKRTGVVAIPSSSYQKMVIGSDYRRKLNGCVAVQMTGKRFANQEDARLAFKQAVEFCKKTLGEEKK